MANFILVGITCLLAWFVLWIAIPALGRIGSTDWLHSLRRRLYKLRDSDPKLAHSLLAQDTEWVLSVAIWTVRNEDFLGTARILGALGSGSKTHRSEARKRYANDPASLEQMIALLGFLRSLTLALAYRFMTGHPLLILISPVVLTYVVLRVFWSFASPNSDAPSRAGSKIIEVRRVATAVPVPERAIAA